VKRSRPVVLLALAFASVAPLAASAQEARPSRVAIDTAAAVDDSVDANGRHLTGLWVDAVVSVGLGKGFEAVAWPIAQRVANTGVRSADLWIATLRYERPGPIGVRVDGGLLGSPVGLANLSVRRPHLNPTIAQPAALFTALPALEPGGPRPNLLGAIYPFGGQVSVSGTRWDARAAVIDTSPLRRRGIFVDPKPPRFANLVLGGGVTPFVGFRVGASMTRGGWMRAGESPTTPTTRNATIVTVESELSFAYSKVAGEWVRDAIETSSGTRVATGWFVQGQQTLAPRWFVAGRVERLESPLVSLASSQAQRMTTVEETLGYRVTQDLTVRAGHRARRGFGRPDYGHQFSMSLVWWKRWI
jgi:hypothetical protein